MYRQCTIAACQFEKIASPGTLIFECTIIAIAALTLALFATHKQYEMVKRFGLIALGVIMFELFTQPLWNNHHMSEWAYLYIDVSWVLTLGWTIILFYAWMIAEHVLLKKKQLPQFFLTLLIATVAGLIGECVVVSLGIRTYAPEVQQMLSGFLIPFTQVPVEAAYYMPVFMALVLSFAKYWEIIFNKIPLVPQKKIVNWRSILIAFIGVFLFEVMNAPAIRNIGWPAWSYVYYDVTIVRIALWVLVLAIGALIVQRLFIHLKPATQFILSIAILTVLTVPIECYLVTIGMRQYGPSLQASYSGFHIPGTLLPVEILFAVPLYLALIVAFVRYWSSVWENDL